APRWNPFHLLVNGIQRSATQLIDADEELLDIAKDDGCFRTPTVRIRVMKRLFPEQHAALAQKFNDVTVGLEDILSSEIWQTSCLPTRKLVSSDGTKPVSSTN